jgi:hypothetical protein
MTCTPLTPAVTLRFLRLSVRGLVDVKLDA